MKIKLKKSKFEDHLETVSRATQSNAAVPSLQGVMIIATESNIQLVGSNGNLSIKEIIEPSSDISVIEPGKVLVPGTLFKNIIKQQSEDVEIFTEENSLIIDSNGTHMKIQLLNTEDYPTISFEATGKELVVDAEALDDLIKNTSFASAENDKRVILNGVNLSSSEGKLTSTATNSFRLAKETIEVDSNSEFNITIVSKNLKGFMPKGAKGPLTISVNDSKIITKHGNTTLMSNLIDGIYPEVSKLIPTQVANVLKINSKEFINLIDRATVVANENNKVVRISITKNELKVESKRREIGDAVAKTTEIEWSSADEFVIVLNAQFLKEALMKFSGKTAIVFNGSYDPVVIKGESNKNLTQLILPHRSY